jgi:hypothetical protein
MGTLMGNTLAILFFALKPKVKKLLSIEIEIFIPSHFLKHNRKKYWSQEFSSNNLEKGSHKHYKTDFCSSLALTLLEKKF